MGALLLLTLLSSILLVTDASESSCPFVKCGHGAPNITYPFHVKGLQRCGHPGFDLSCKENATMIRFRDYGELVVKTISYDTRKIDLLDPKSCVHGVFLDLDLSLTPFRYYYVVKNYTYLNCSDKLSPSSFNEVSCLSGSRHHVYTVESSSPVPDSCRPVKTVAIPFSFSPYLSDNSFGLGLTWDMPGCGETNETRQRPGSDRGFKTKWVATVLGISIFILALAFVLLRTQIQRPNKLDGQMGNENQLEGEKLLGEPV